MSILQKLILREILEGRKDLSWIVDNLRKSTAFSAAEITTEIRLMIRSGTLKICDSVQILDYNGQPLYTADNKVYQDYRLDVAIEDRPTDDDA